MTPSAESDREHLGRPRRRFVRLTAAGITVGVVAATIVGSSGASAAAATKPKAQSVGRFLDGSAGGMAIQQLADLVDARATAAPDTSDRNPLEAKLLGQLDAPVGSALQLPGGGALNLGAANQLADAKADGSSLGASGAVSNSGGASLGGDNSAYPADAKLNLTAAALGSVSLPALPTIPGLPSGLPVGSADALGGVTGSIGAVDALVQTNKGGKIVTPSSSVADVKLNIGSPALGALLSQLKGILSPSVLTGLLGGQANTSVLTTLLNTLPGTVTTTLGSVLTGIGLGGVVGGLGLPGLARGASSGRTPAANGTSATDCALTDPAPSTVSLDDGAVTIDPTTATISIDVGKLLQVVLGKDISNLDTSNFDLIDFLVKNLPSILSTGLTSLITGITNSLQTQFAACVNSLGTALGQTALTSTLTTTLTSILQPGQTMLTNAIAGLAGQFSSASAAPLTQLASGLKQVIDIGLNVQSGPGIQPAETTYPFTTGLKATPNQATSVVQNQTLVRAIEIDILPAGAGGTASLPALPLFRQAAAPRAAAAGGGVAVLALGNAAAGPSTTSTVRPTPTPTVTPTTGIPGLPTGIPAGAAGHRGGGSPALPLVLVLIGLVLAGGGATVYRARGKYSH